MEVGARLLARIPFLFGVGMNFTTDELETCLKVLQHISDDPSVADGHEASRR
jgi:hypothetical protein